MKKFTKFQHFRKNLVGFSENDQNGDFYNFGPLEPSKKHWLEQHLRLGAKNDDS